MADCKDAELRKEFSAVGRQIISLLRRRRLHDCFLLSVRMWLIDGRKTKGHKWPVHNWLILKRPSCMNELNTSLVAHAAPLGEVRMSFEKAESYQRFLLSYKRLLLSYKHFLLSYKNLLRPADAPLVDRRKTECHECLLAAKSQRIDRRSFERPDQAVGTLHIFGNSCSATKGRQIVC